MTMATRSEQLYNEFLGHYHLDQGLYNHAELLSRTTFKKIDTLKVATFERMRVPVSEAVKNSATFRFHLHQAKIFAGRVIKEVLRGYRSFPMDGDDVQMMCARLEDQALNQLLWPFHLLTVESELVEKDFYPLANMMEAVVCDFLDLEDAFVDAFFAGEDRIRRQAQNEIEEKNRQTRAWAANAPVEVRGTARVFDGRLHIDATVRSTVTQGQIAADYQVHELLANQSAKRQMDQQQKRLLDQLEEGLTKVVEGYLPGWYNCLENQLGLMAGKCVITNTVIGKGSNYQPHIKEKVMKFLGAITENDSFDKLEQVLRYYDHDYDDLYGQKVAAHMINDFVKEQKIDENYLYYRFYCHFYGIDHPVEHTLMYKRIREIIERQVRASCESTFKSNKQAYIDTPHEKQLVDYYRLIDAIPGLTEKQNRQLVHACCYIFYDVMGNISTRDIYDEEKGVPVFDWTPDENEENT